MAEQRKEVGRMGKIVTWAKAPKTLILGLLVLGLRILNYREAKVRNRCCLSPQSTKLKQQTNRKIRRKSMNYWKVPSNWFSIYCRTKVLRSIMKQFKWRCSKMPLCMQRRGTHRCLKNLGVSPQTPYRIMIAIVRDPHHHQLTNNEHNNFWK